MVVKNTFHSMHPYAAQHRSGSVLTQLTIGITTIFIKNYGKYGNIFPFTVDPHIL